MSGHSKWSQIKRQKGVADQRRGQLFTKLANTITIAAKNGGDPEMNFRLRLAMDKARAANMPKENVDRAIKRGTGELGGTQIQEVTYEGFGPDALPIIIETLTDNPNRTVSILRNILNKYGGNLGNSNSVLWQFEHRGVLVVKNEILKEEKLTPEEFELKAIDFGAVDIKEEAGDIVVYTKPLELKKVKDQIEKFGLTIEYAELEYIAKEKQGVDPKTKEKFDNLFAELEASEEVKDYYTNLKDEADK